MAIELEPEGIKVNAVSPGFTKTNLNGYAGTETARRGRPRGGARGAARRGRPDRDVHALGKQHDPVVMSFADSIGTDV